MHKVQKTALTKRLLTKFENSYFPITYEIAEWSWGQQPNTGKILSVQDTLFFLQPHYGFKINSIGITFEIICFDTLLTGFYEKLNNLTEKFSNYEECQFLFENMIFQITLIKRYNIDRIALFEIFK